MALRKHFAVLEAPFGAYLKQKAVSMSIQRCKQCHQPITREMAISTKAGGFTGGLCQRDARGYSLGATMQDNEATEPGIVPEAIETDNAAPAAEATSEQATEAPIAEPPVEG